MNSHQNHFDLNWLRGLAALMVLVSHIFLFNTTHLSSFTFLLNAGHVGVEIFFVLSGFLIALSWADKPSLPDYAARRARRILPLMWVVTAVTFFILAPIFLEWSLAIPMHWLTILLHFIGLQSAIPTEIPGLFFGLPLWTLTVEICFYAILPFWWRWFVRAPAEWVVSSFVVEVAWRAVADNFVGAHGLTEQWALYLPLQLPGQAFGFSVGMLLAWLFLHDRDKEFGRIAFAQQICAEAGIAFSPIEKPKNQTKAHGREVCWDEFDESGWMEGGVEWINPWLKLRARENFAQWFCRVAGEKLGIWPEDMPKWLSLRVGLVGLGVGMIFFQGLWDSGASILIFPLFAALTIWSSALAWQCRSSLGMPVRFVYGGLSVIGKISYSLYLWHFPVLFVLNRLVGGLTFTCFALTGLVLAVVVAAISYENIEKPFLMKRKE